MRITFVLPHQRSTTGGVYSIETYAQHMAAWHDVSLAVARGEPKPLTGCEVVPLDQAKPADCVIYPTELANVPLPKGQPLSYLQGHVHNPEVTTNLKLGHPVVASSKWLRDTAKDMGCAAAHVPYGIDRDCFWPGPTADSRPTSVLMMTHKAEFKRTKDGLAALKRVKAQRPHTVVTLFGLKAPWWRGARFIRRPPRAQVASLMRDTAIYLCSSREEGFGMPGLEAMACGAALVTTDTKGSRDYAHHDQTALVAEPYHVRELSRHVLTLLEDPERLRRIAQTGFEMSTSFPSWEQSARLFDSALRDLQMSGRASG